MFAVAYQRTEQGARARQSTEAQPASRREAVIRLSQEWERRRREQEERDRKRDERRRAELREMLKSERTPVAGLLYVADLVSRMHGFTLAEAASDSRRYEIKIARQAAMCAVKAQRPDYSLSEVGKLFNRDAGTVRHSYIVRGFI